MTRLLVARSWAPPEDECPVSAKGSSVASDPAHSTGVHDHRSTGMLASVTTTANTAVQRHAPATSTRPATDQISSGLRCAANGWPLTSETVSATISVAHTAQMPEATVPTRSAR